MSVVLFSLNVLFYFNDDENQEEHFLLPHCAQLDGHSPKHEKNYSSYPMKSESGANTSGCLQFLNNTVNFTFIFGTNPSFNKVPAVRF